MATHSSFLAWRIRGTAGMGGGTGTGAAPFVASIARELGILTVGIVTIPFLFEGKRKIRQALEGVAAMSENVDALLVIHNERLCSVYPDLELSNAFGLADDVLTSRRSILRTRASNTSRPIRSKK